MVKKIYERICGGKREIRAVEQKGLAEDRGAQRLRRAQCKPQGKMH